jgi:hypothetical protein
MRGGRKEGVDLGGVGEDGGLGRVGQLGDVHRRSGREVMVVAVTVGGAGGLELELRRKVVEGGADFDAAALEVGIEGALGGVERALALGAILQPAEPVDDAVADGAVEVGEAIAGVFIPVHLCGETELMKVADALDTAGGGLAGGKGGEQQGGEDGNHGNDDQQFNQGESAAGFTRPGTGARHKDAPPARAVWTDMMRGPFH